MSQPNRHPEDILGPELYKTYRPVQIVVRIVLVFGWLFVIFGALSAIVTVVQSGQPPSKDDTPLGLSIFMFIFGLAAIVGCRSAMKANRRWAKVLYAVMFPYLFAIPIGTIASYMILKGLGSYMDGVEKLRASEPQNSQN
jgi:hypothetical protein